MSTIAAPAADLRTTGHPSALAGHVSATEAPPPVRRGAPKGRPKPPGSGRKKGTLNRRTAAIHDLMASMKCDPRVTLARIAMNRKAPLDLRRKAAADLMPYLYPKLVAQEVTGRDGSPLMPAVSVNTTEGEQRVANLLRRAMLHNPELTAALTNGEAADASA